MLPDVAFNNPVTIRKNVVLPAPSGPMSANISPLSMVNDTLFRATVRSNVRVRPVVVIMSVVPGGHRCRRLHVNLRWLSGHERDAPTAHEIDFRAVDQVHALLARLHLLGRELGVGCNLGDDGLERSARE